MPCADQYIMTTTHISSFQRYRAGADYRSFMRRTHGQRGAGLIEILVAVLVLSIGMLGLAGMQAAMLRNADSSLLRTQATVLAYDIMDAMRANAEAAGAGAYNRGTADEENDACEIPPEGTTLAERDLRDWMTRLKTTLGDSPATCGAIECTSPSTDDIRCTVTIQWDDSRALGGLTQTAVTVASRL